MFQAGQAGGPQRAGPRMGLPRAGGLGGHSPAQERPPVLVRGPRAVHQPGQFPVAATAPGAKPSAKAGLAAPHAWMPLSPSRSWGPALSGGIFHWDTDLAQSRVSREGAVNEQLPKKKKVLLGGARLGDRGLTAPPAALGHVVLTQDHVTRRLSTARACPTRREAPANK